MNRIPGLRGWVAAACAALVVAGCASTPPPTEQMAVSKSAIANAVSAGGAEYAPVEMRGAQEKMNSADHAMHKKDYEDARMLAVEAQADARPSRRPQDDGLHCADDR